MLSNIIADATRETPSRVRIGYKLIYDIYISNEIKRRYKLQANVINDISEALFARIQHYAQVVELVDVLTRGSDISFNFCTTVPVFYQCSLFSVSIVLLNRLNH